MGPIKLIWTALFTSVFICVFVAVIKSQGAELSFANAIPDFSDIFEMALTFMLIPVLSASVFLPNLIISAIQKKFSNQESMGTIPLSDVVRELYPPWIIRLALLESITLLGFVLATVKHQPARILFFAVVSIIGFLLNYPSEERLRAALRR